MALASPNVVGGESVVSFSRLELEIAPLVIAYELWARIAACVLS